MARGKVKWFNDNKGFGFITDPGVDEDGFVHFSQIGDEGFRTIQEGEDVEYELHYDEKGSRAGPVTRLEFAGISDP